MAEAAAVLDALGDPTRRSILEALRAGPLPVGELASRLPISRPGVSQHLRVLRDAGLVTETTVGTRHLHRLDPAGLRAVHAWLDGFWTEALAGFAALAASTGTHDVTDPPEETS